MVMCWRRPMCWAGKPSPYDSLSGKPGNVREFDSCHGKNPIRDKLPKTVYCKLHICINTGI